MNAEQQAALREPFPPELIGQLPKAGAMLDFVGHGAVRDRFLQVDHEWTWAPFALDDAGLPALDEFGNLWINLTIGGVTRPGVGDGPNMKERIGDALRNAGMSFGVALDLWIRGGGDHAEQQEQSRRPRRQPPRVPETNDERIPLPADLLARFDALAADAKERLRSWAERAGEPDIRLVPAAWVETVDRAVAKEEARASEPDGSRRDRAEQHAAEHGTSVTRAQEIAERHAHKAADDVKVKAAGG